jgi:hypothetical protein
MPPVFLKPEFENAAHGLVLSRAGELAGEGEAEAQPVGHREVEPGIEQ